MNANQQYIIGIDGGGTKTQAILATSDGTVLSEMMAGASNPQVVGFTASAKIIFNLIRGCCGKIEQPIKSVRTAVAGIAGIGRQPDKAQLHAELMRLSDWNKNIGLENDARIALEAALPWRAGIVLISGTGSIAFYRTEENKFLRAGGWGRILGDEGSGFAIARDALRSVMLQFEGRGKETLLTQKAVEFFQLESIDHLVSAIKKIGGDIASFAPHVLEAASQHDRVAGKILESGAQELYELIKILLKKYPPVEKLTIATVGGLLDNENMYSTMVKKKISESFSHIYFQKPKFPPVYGALILALDPFHKNNIHQKLDSK